MIGKILGGFFGFLLFGTIGSLIGIVFGHFFDKNRSIHILYSKKNMNIFYRSLFSTIGKYSKIFKIFIDFMFIEQIIKNIGLNSIEKKYAIKYLEKGKKDDFNIFDFLNEFKNIFIQNGKLQKTFIDILLEIAFLNGNPSSEEKNFLLKIAKKIGIHEEKFRAIFFTFSYKEQFHSGWNFYSEYYYNNDHGSKPYNEINKHELIEQAYSILGISPTNDIYEIKKTYLKLMKQHHPDKLIAKGFSEEAIKKTTKKVQKIRESYEILKKHCKK